MTKIFLNIRIHKTIFSLYFMRMIVWNRLVGTVARDSDCSWRRFLENTHLEDIRDGNLTLG